ncbi:sphingosine-1-phosphate lyase-like [Tigriopus californicus]|uniref:sphingosine-1-phosphate lyase-like n=1 Tax=Tigriopus californicus TaxID=6832 RepID=UPI0027DA074C|nr:sphingosine-1-phosphate lyase-like [Tigriopus californicus]
MDYLNKLDRLLTENLDDGSNPAKILDSVLYKLKPWQIVTISLVCWISLRLLIKSLICIKNTNWKVALFRTLRKIPFVQRKIQEELDKTVGEMEVELKEQIGGLAYHQSLPKVGWNKDQVLKEIEKNMDLGKFKAETGALSGTCHKPPNMERVETMTSAYKLTAFANPLNPDAFPGIRKFEAEVVRMTLNLFHGDDKACGTMTSGGTESLIMACKAYRGYGKAKRGITKPNIVMSSSGHVGFDKAGHLMHIDVRHVPMDPKTMHPDLKKFRQAIDSNTIMLVASAPQYPHGIMDPIEDIAQLGLDYNIPVHVDACLGGFLITFMEEAGFEIGKFDFQVPGVTSISADTHKFGYAPKGSSVIMYRSKEYIHYQYYVSADWTGGIFASPTMAGSRSGGLIAATWACMVNHGMDGYRESTRKVVSTLQFIVKEIRSIKGLRVLGDPRSCIVAFTSDDFHIFSLADAMKEKGWLLSCLQYPTCVHLYVIPMHTQEGVKENFLKELRSVAATLLTRPKDTKLEGRAAVYGMAQTLPDRGLVDEMAQQFLDTLYTTKN